MVISAGCQNSKRFFPSQGFKGAKPSAVQRLNPLGQVGEKWTAVLSCLAKAPGVGSAGFFGQGAETRRSMAQHCQFCGKIPMTGHRVSHAHNLSNRKWHLNLKTVRTVVNGVTRRVSACTRCIRSGKVVKPAPRRKTA